MEWSQIHSFDTCAVSNMRLICSGGSRSSLFALSHRSNLLRPTQGPNLMSMSNRLRMVSISSGICEGEFDVSGFSGIR